MAISNLVFVLVIEDEEDSFLLIKETLLDKPIGWPLKYKVQNAKTLAEANKLLSKNGKYNIVILDLDLPDSKGAKTFYNLKADVPVFILTQQVNGIFEQLIRDGAKRCYNKTFIRSCMGIIHYSIRHVLAGKALEKTVAQQDQTIKGQLRPTIVECAGCRRWRDEKTNNWTSVMNYLKQRGFIISHSHCPDCEQDFYGKVLTEMTEDYK